MDYTNRKELHKLLAEHNGVLLHASRASGIPESTLRRWRNKFNSPEVTTAATDQNSLIELLFEAGEDVTGEKILNRLNLDPVEYVVSGLSVTEWHSITGEGVRVPMLRVNAAVKRQTDSAIVLQKLLERNPVEILYHQGDGGSGEWDIKISDPHFPRDEPTITQGFLAFLKEHSDNIRSVSVLGDAIDNSPFKRHRRNNRTDAPIMDNINPFYYWLLEIRKVVPHAVIRVVFGNHDWWMYQRILEVLPDLMDVCIAGTSEPLVTLERILKLDEIGVELHTTDGEYHDVDVTTYEDLVEMHGVLTGPNGGAIKELDKNWEQTSIIQAHDHKTAMITRVFRLPKKKAVMRMAISIGAICKRDMGYSHAQQVGQSFAIISDHGKGRWHPEYCLYWPQHDCLTFRDWTYEGDR